MAQRPPPCRAQTPAEVLAGIGAGDASKYGRHLANVSQGPQGASGWVLAAPARAYFLEKANVQVPPPSPMHALASSCLDTRAALLPYCRL